MNLPLQMSGGTATELLSRDVQQLLADDDVASTVLLVDSPGGSCHGTGELATKLCAARGTEPVIACVSSLYASAAYSIASQADRRDSDGHGLAPDGIVINPATC